EMVGDLAGCYGECRAVDRGRGSQVESMASRGDSVSYRLLSCAVKCADLVPKILFCCLGYTFHKRALCFQGEPVDESSVKKMILTFEKRSYKNQELRIKFPDTPGRFMETELDLNDIIQEMHVIATMPDLYHLLVELNAVHSLLGLLSHENTDILSFKDVVDLLQELTDIDTLQESEEGAEVLIDSLLEGQVVALLVQNMERLDEQVKEEADGVYNTLAIIENMAEFRPGLCTEAAQQGLMQWLLKRIKAKIPFDANKLYCSEILAILLQNNDSTRELLGELDGIDVLLQQLSVFKRHNPATAEEQEMMENLFDALCSCLMLAANRDRFLRGEGLQLMNLMLREKKMSRTSALKVLDHGMIGPEGSDDCHKFVDILGLRTIFPLFMKTPKKMRKAGTVDKEHEEHVCSIIASCLRNLKAQQRTRLLSKFTENDCEKVDRLMELHFKYLEAVQLADKRIEGEKHVRVLPLPPLRYQHPVWDLLSCLSLKMPFPAVSCAPSTSFVQLAAVSGSVFISPLSFRCYFLG
uniref:Beta-catenin-like protein 1 n=1 Tax=Oncorhynchus mykiss TaxID=8022 RepID=A0A8C7TT68_ONCMY